MAYVLITDEKSPNYESNAEYFANIDRWAQEILGVRYLGYHVQDVSDTSLQWDEIARFDFIDEETAVWFKLRWH